MQLTVVYNDSINTTELNLITQTVLHTQTRIWKNKRLCYLTRSTSYRQGRQTWELVRWTVGVQLGQTQAGRQQAVLSCAYLPSLNHTQKLNCRPLARCTHQQTADTVTYSTIIRHITATDHFNLIISF